MIGDATLNIPIIEDKRISCRKDRDAIASIADDTVRKLAEEIAVIKVKGLQYVLIHNIVNGLKAKTMKTILDNSKPKQLVSNTRTNAS
jgi:hypothetical protein